MREDTKTLGKASKCLAKEQGKRRDAMTSCDCLLLQGYLRKFYSSGDDMQTLAKAFTRKESEAVVDVAKNFRKVEFCSFLITRSCASVDVLFLE